MADKTCSITGCERDSAHIKRGLCEIHYKREWRAGRIRPEAVPVRAVLSIEEAARAAVAEVERKRALHAERLAGCPLERWLERRGPVSKSNVLVQQMCSCGCHVRKYNKPPGRWAA